jgi:hypothetical protein
VLEDEHKMDAITQLLTRMDTDMNGAEMVAVIHEAARLLIDLMSVDELGAAIRRLRVQIKGLRDRAVPVTATESSLINQLRAMMDEDLNAAEMITTVKACTRLLTNLMSVDELGAEIRRLYPQLQALQGRPRAEPEENDIDQIIAMMEVDLNYTKMVTTVKAASLLQAELMSVDELSAEIRRLYPLLVQRRARAAFAATRQASVDATPPSPIAVAESIEVVVAERLAQPSLPAGTAEPKPRPPYNHHIWPSPLPRLMVLELRRTDNKRIPHDRALALLAERFRCSVEEFLTKSRQEVAEVLFPMHHNYGKGWRAPSGIRKLLYRY